jgi:hypothetical protein
LEILFGQQKIYIKFVLASRQQTRECGSKLASTASSHLHAIAIIDLWKMKKTTRRKIEKSNKFFIINSLNISMKQAKRRDDRQLKRDDKKHLIDKEERERERREMTKNL